MPHPPAPAARPATAGTLAAVSDELIRELGTALPGVAVRLGPATTADAAAVTLTPLAFLPRPAQQGGRRSAALGLVVRYLVNVAETTPAAELALWDRLLMALVGEPGVEFDPPGPALWGALGLAPRPALWLSRPIEVTPPAAPVTRVRETVVALGSLGAIHGRVADPDGRAVARATVELADGARRTSCDEDGRFHLSGVPAGARRLRVTAHDRTVFVTAFTGPEPQRIVLTLED